MNIAITGADGFIGRNLCLHLQELGHRDIACITRDTPWSEVEARLSETDFVFHLAGVNRPQDASEFAAGNAGLTRRLCSILSAAGRKATLVLSSSTQAGLANPYGESKAAAEQAVIGYAEETGAAVHIFRLPNVFGKWAKPNYNSAVATFCYNIARGLPITVNDPAAALQLVYVDDVVGALAGLLAGADPAMSFMEVEPVYQTTVGELAEMLAEFAKSRQSLKLPAVGTGFGRALYSTYVSYLPPRDFSYDVPAHGDARGVFVEMLKTADSGQFSYFTAKQGVTRGDHYHHTKTEKFLVLQGVARFAFRNVATGETCELVTRGGEDRIVDTIPGWAHNITNIGESELLVMLWANEIFDPQRPDTIGMKVDV